MKRQVLFCHPEDHTLTWAGFGFKPDWLYAFLSRGGTEEQAAWAAVRAGYRSADSMPQGAVSQGVATVTKNPGLVQEQLPGLPPVPKKRGRPATGNAKSAAQRKRDSRERARNLESGHDLSVLTDVQLCDAVYRAVSNAKSWQCKGTAKWQYDRLIAELNSRVTAICSS